MNRAMVDQRDYWPPRCKPATVAVRPPLVAGRKNSDLCRRRPVPRLCWLRFRFLCGFWNSSRGACCIRLGFSLGTNPQGLFGSLDQLFQRRRQRRVKVHLAVL